MQDFLTKYYPEKEEYMKSGNLHNNILEIFEFNSMWL